jgi:hypothetical protein
MCPQYDAPQRLAPEPAAPVEKEKEQEQAKEKERRLDAGNRHLDHCACTRASHIQDRLLSAEQMLDACPNGAMPCATA